MMQDYEHMMIAVDEYICHFIAGVICYENYFGKAIPKAYRSLFRYFQKVRKDFENNKVLYENGTEDEKIRFQLRCRKKKELFFKKYLEQMKKVKPSIDFREAAEKYFEDLDKENLQTAEMYLDIYPMIISLIRKEEEKDD